jgi:hypothetical protein
MWVFLSPPLAREVINYGNKPGGDPKFEKILLGEKI